MVSSFSPVDIQKALNELKLVKRATSAAPFDAHTRYECLFSWVEHRQQRSGWPKNVASLEESVQRTRTYLGSNLNCRIDERNVLEPIRHPICTFEKCFVSYEAVEVKKEKLGYCI